jgi:hypothetical protein
LKPAQNKLVAVKTITISRPSDVFDGGDFNVRQMRQMKPLQLSDELFIILS